MGFKANRFDGARPRSRSVGARKHRSTSTEHAQDSSKGREQLQHPAAVLVRAAEVRPNRKPETPSHTLPHTRLPSLPSLLPFRSLSPLLSLPHPRKSEQSRAARRVELSRAGASPTLFPPRAAAVPLSPYPCLSKSKRGRPAVPLFVGSRTGDSQLSVHPTPHDTIPLFHHEISDLTSTAQAQAQAQVGCDLRLTTPATPALPPPSLARRTEVLHLTPLTRIPSTIVLGYPTSALQSIDKSKFSAEALHSPTSQASLGIRIRLDFGKEQRKLLFLLHTHSSPSRGRMNVSFR